MKLKLCFFLIAAFIGSTEAFAQSGNQFVTWGGHGIRILLNFDTVNPPTSILPGSTVEFDCAHGTLDKVVADGSGGFVAFGTMVSEHGGPSRQGEKPEVKNALYVGHMDSKLKLRLSAYVIESGFPKLLRVDSVSTATAPWLMKCLGSASANN